MLCFGRRTYPPALSPAAPPASPHRDATSRLLSPNTTPQTPRALDHSSKTWPRQFNSAKPACRSPHLVEQGHRFAHRVLTGPGACTGRGPHSAMQNLGLPLPDAAAVILGAVTLYFALRYAAGRKLHPSEPTVLPPRIPFIGHLLGMAMQGGRYIKRLGLSYPWEPIFTLPVPGSRIYVVTDPSLAAVVQRNSRALSFTPLIPDITKRVLGLDDETVKVVRQNLDPEPGEPRGFLADMHDMVYGSLGPGHYLNTLSCEASQELCLQLRKLQASLLNEPSLGDSTDLLSLVRHIVTIGTARYLFGAINPISENPELEHAFWDFDEGLGGLLIGMFPSITASQAYRGRESIVAAFIDYLESKQDTGASQIVRDRIRVEREWEMSVEMIARSALSFLFAGIVNTTTTTFWVVLRLFADPSLLASVREEIKTALAASEDQNGSDTLSITIVRDNCPMLSAVFRESLRIGSENFSVRLIKQDTMLAGKYFLKKDAVVQISGGVIHSDRSIWGDDVDEFNPNRFLGAKSRSGGFHPAAFRGFGGGKTMCPGQHFAINEILLFVSMIVLGFDLEAPAGGPISVPCKNDRVMPVHILEPGLRDRPKVVIKPRDDSELLNRLTITT